jgi:predicted nuclease of predicted toxin-antitoxin system
VRFLVDENLPRSIAERARGASHEATWVGDVLHGEPDSVILSRLRETGEVLVTRDVRFANMVGATMARVDDFSGVVLIREQSPQAMKAAWERFLADPGTIAGLVVLTQGGTRRHVFR